MKGLILAALLLLVASVALADDNPRQYPLVSLARLHVGLRGEYEWGGDSTPSIQQATVKQFRFGLVGAYSLVPKLAAIGRVTAAVGSAVRYDVGLNWELFNGKEYADKKGL